MKEAQVVVEHLDREEVRMQQTYEYGGDPQTSPIEALRRHRNFQDSIMTQPTHVISQGVYFLSGFLDSQDLTLTKACHL